MGVVLKVTMIIQMFLVGFSFGGIPLFGFLTGAGEQRKVKSLLRFCLLFLTILSLAMTIMIFLVTAPLLGLITPDAQLVADGVPMLRWQVAGSVFAGIMMLATCLCQASGKALPALILSLSRQGIIFMIVLLAASSIAGYMGVLASQCISDILSAFVAASVFVCCLGGRQGRPGEKDRS